MYKAFYGLHDKPFSQTPDLKYFYSGPSQREALAFLSSAIKQRNSHYIVLTGDIGSGKTMFLRNFIKDLGRNYSVIQVRYPARTGLQLLQMILAEAGIETTSEDPDLLRKKLRDHLMMLKRERKGAILVLDEAQNLGEDAFRETYHLAGLADGEDHLIKIVFSGLPIMLKKINSLQHSGLTAQADIFHLANLSVEEVGEYIRHHLVAVGRSDAIVFPGEIIREVSRLSNGAPRMINMICDALLTHGYFAHEKVITQSTLKEVMNKLFYLDAGDSTPPFEDFAFHESRAGQGITGRRISACDENPAQSLNVNTEPPIHDKKVKTSCDETSITEYKLPLTVLILEKNARMKVHLENEFQRHGYNFLTIQRPEELFEALERSPAGHLPVIIADTAFFFTATGDEDPQGKGVLDRIQAKYAYVPMIMTSTLPLTGIRTKLFQRGIPFLLNKPDISGIDMSEVSARFNLFFHTLQNSIANIHCQLSQFYNMVLKWNPKNTD